MAKKRITTTKTVQYYCRDCQKAVPVMDFHTLSIKGEPTMARCPHVKGHCVLLSQKACDNLCLLLSNGDGGVNV